MDEPWTLDPVTRVLTRADNIFQFATEAEVDRQVLPPCPDPCEASIRLGRSKGRSGEFPWLVGPWWRCSNGHRGLVRRP